jgi:RNA polymerase sigma-70 factor (ECF subfamily)
MGHCDPDYVSENLVLRIDGELNLNAQASLQPTHDNPLSLADRTSAKVHDQSGGNRDKREVPPSEAAFCKDLVELMPFLNAFSLSLCKDRELAKDLAQEALANAWQGRTTFHPRSNLKAWLFTILRNLLYSHHRRAWRQVSYDERMLDIPGSEDSQYWAVLASDAVRALRALRPEQHKALMLVGLGGFGYAEGAAICGCPVGTVKSRVTRARQSALAALDGPGPLAGRRPPIGRAADELIGELQNAKAALPKRVHLGRRRFSATCIGSRPKRVADR